MNPAFSHRGYTAHVAFSAEDDAFVGRLVGIRDVVGFHGQSVDELRAAFVEAVDDYIETCKALGRPPERPASGRLVLRLPAELHGRLRSAAEREGQSLNAYLVGRLDKAA